jgi:hypothetical protein
MTGAPAVTCRKGGADRIVGTGGADIVETTVLREYRKERRSPT